MRSKDTGSTFSKIFAIIFLFLLTSFSILSTIVGSFYASLILGTLAASMVLCGTTNNHALTQFYKVLINKYTTITTGILGIIFLFIHALNGLHGLLPKIFFSVLGGIFYVSVIGLFRPHLTAIIGPTIFFSACFHCFFEFLGFNFFLSPSNWYYSPWAEGAYNSYTDPVSGIFRFWGVYGRHPGINALTIAIIATILDGARSSKSYRIIAALLGFISLSGMGLISSIILLLSLFRIKKLESRPMRAVLFFVKALTLILTLIVIAGVGSSFFSKISPDYVHQLFNLKINQISPFFANVQNDMRALMFGISASSISEIQQHVPGFGSTDWGVGHRIVYAGLVGFTIMILQAACILGLTIPRLTHNVSGSLFLLILLCFFHYSPLNVVASNFAISASMFATFAETRSRRVAFNRMM